VSDVARPVATRGPVLVVGTGLLGTSLALALTGAGVEVQLSDTSPTSLQLAVDMGAGRAVASSSPGVVNEGAADRPAGPPRLVVVATPPDVAGPCVVAALRAHPGAVVTDVASVKEIVAREVAEAACAAGDPDLARRYVGSHPMAGRERSGAGSADADLFVGRPWVVVAPADCEPRAVLAVRTLAADVGAVPVELDAATHDRSVALVSHVPQLVASLLAARLAEAPSSMMGLAGQGLRDTTRIAASDPRLWAAIIGGNAGPVADVLHALRDDLDPLIDALDRARVEGPLRGGSAGAVTRVMTQGNRGVARIPGKHGGAPQRFAEVEVLVPDRPGELGRLFGELGEIGVNIEDLTLDHSAGQRVGVARVMVDPVRARDAEVELERRGWRIVAHAAREEGAQARRRDRIRRVGIVIGIDGPAGSGKSTVSRRLATELGIGYLDTGAMYRSLTWFALDQGLDLADQQAVAAAAERMPLTMDSDPLTPRYVVGDTDVTTAIRDRRIAESVTAVSTNLGVRQWMARDQRRRMLEARDSGSGMVAEGRDITTVVCPDADVRVLLLADSEARLARRTLELYGDTTQDHLEATRRQVEDRDAADSTVSQFLTPAPGVSVVDSSGLSVERVVDAVLALVDRDLATRAGD